MTDAPPRRAAPRPAAVLWDMDGTIVDTEPYWIECEYAIVAEFGDHWDDDKAHALVGQDLRVSARMMQELGGVRLEIDDIVNRLLDGVIERVRRHVPWRPGARDLLAKLKAADVPCALVTMSWSRFANAVVEALPKGTFAVVISGDDVTRGKPHPDPYLAAAHALGVRAEDCVAIEDSPTGVRSAVAAGCRTIAVPNVVEIPPDKAYRRVESLVDVDLESLGVRVTGGGSSGPRARRRRRGWAIGLAVVAVLAAAAVWVVRDQSPPPLADVPMGAWAPYWVLDDATASITAQGELFHEISPFWYEARGATDVGLAANVTPELTAPFLAAAQASGAAIVPAVADGMPKGGMAAVLADPAQRTAHVQTLLALARDNGFAGLDIDYEQFAFADDRSTWAATSEHWIAFLTELADGLHAEGRTLSVAVPPIYDTEQNPESGYWVYDYAAMGDIVDHIRIMAYDYSVAQPGPIAPVDWVRSVVKAAKKAVGDDTKLSLGVPLYGRNWVVATTGTCPADAPGRTNPNLHEIDALVAQYGAVPVFDEATGESSFTYQRVSDDGTTSCTQTRQVHFVDEQGALARVDIAREERIGAVTFWALGFDTSDVWTQVSPYATPRTATTE